MPITVHRASEREPKKTFAQKLNLGVGRGLETAEKLYNEHQEKEGISKKFGEEIANLPPELQKIYAQEKFKSEFTQPKTDKNDQKAKDTYIDLKGALGRIQSMRDIRSKGNLGRGSSILGFFGGETAKDKGAYETLGNSLIQNASTINIRNRVEFEKLAGKISDSSTTDSEAEGILNELETIISDSLKKYEPEDSLEVDEETEGVEQKVLDEEAMKKIYELSKGDKNKAKKIAKKMGYKI